MTRDFAHESVMPEEVSHFFKSGPRKILVDATAGGGGHLAMLADIAGPQGKVFAFDRDLRAHQDDAALGVKKRHTNINLYHRPFSEIKRTLAAEGIEQVDGILADLGVSSNQLDDQSRGFSFMADGPIDMRMDQSQKMTAYDWLQNNSEKTIADALYLYGGERKSRAIASLIKKSWPIENSTLALAKLVLSAVKQKKWTKIHPATRTFQAIRIAVNEELLELEKLLHDLPDLLAKSAVAVFISFHSLEDRLIKHAFKRIVQDYGDQEKAFAILTKKPVTAKDEEISHNRRSRSAKLRVLTRLK